eukprot:1863624-Pyramimonas_sp.AAC.1
MSAIGKLSSLSHYERFASVPRSCTSPASCTQRTSLSSMCSSGCSVFRWLTNTPCSAIGPSPKRTCATLSQVGRVVTTRVVAQPLW